MKFTLKKENLQKLSTLVKACQTISDVSIKASHYMLHVGDDKLTAVIYGSGNAIKFSVDVSDIEKESNDTGYFNIDITQFIQAFEKVYMASASDTATAEVAVNKITVKSGKSKISTSVFDLLDEADFIEAFSAIEKKKEENFDKDSKFANITKDVVEFSEAVNKFITMVGNDRVSGLGLLNDRILYSDQLFSIVDKKCESQLTKKDEKCFIPQNMFSFISALHKLQDKFVIEFSKDEVYASIFIPEIELKAVLSMPLITCEYPDADTLKAICPAIDNRFSFSIDIPTFLLKMQMFDGVFPAAQWRWKTIDFKIDKANPDTLSMSYSNFNAEVDTDMPITAFSSNSSVDSHAFKLASIIVYDYLNKLNGGHKEATITVSPYETNEEHGIGVVIELENMTFVTCKLAQGDVL